VDDYWVEENPVGDLSGKEAIANMERWAKYVIPGIEKEFGMPLTEINKPQPVIATEPAD